MAAQADTDFAAYLLHNTNDTIRFCERIYEDSIYLTHRADHGLQARGNTLLHRAMHHRSHQSEY